MIRNLFMAGLIILSACKSKTKTIATDTGDKMVKDSVIIPVKDSATMPGPTPGIIEKESLGNLKPGQHYSEVQEFMGPPDTKSKATEWGADGLMHEDWAWKKNGIVLNMSSDKNNKDSTLSIFSITAQAPCDLKTKAGMGIGNSYAEVEAAYKNDIDPYSTNKKQITVGDIYGGIFFTFKDDKVIRVFLGAGAE